MNDAHVTSYQELYDLTILNNFLSTLERLEFCDVMDMMLIYYEFQARLADNRRQP